MTARLQGDQLIVSRRLTPAPERVRQAFTTPADLAAFWGGSHATVPPESVTCDPVEGGELSLETVSSDGASRRLRFVFVSVGDRELVFDEPVTGLRTQVTFEPDGTGTYLTIHQRQLPVELRTQQAAEGLSSIVDALVIHLDSGEKERS